MSGARTARVRLAWCLVMLTQALSTAVLLSLLVGPAAYLPRRLVIFSPAVAAVALTSTPQTNTMSLALTNTLDRSWKFRWVARLNIVNTPSATLEDDLAITTDCGDCRTVGISVQFNVVKRGLGTVTSRSNARSTTACTFGMCVTMGLVLQYTVICDNPFRMLPRVKRLLRRVITVLRGMFPHQQVSVLRVLAGFNALARLFVPHAPPIRLTTAPSSTSAQGPQGPPALSAALVA